MAVWQSVFFGGLVDFLDDLVPFLNFFGVIFPGEFLDFWEIDPEVMSF